MLIYFLRRKIGRIGHARPGVQPRGKDPRTGCGAVFQKQSTIGIHGSSHLLQCHLPEVSGMVQ